MASDGFRGRVVGFGRDGGMGKEWLVLCRR